MTLHDTWVSVWPMLQPAIALAPNSPNVLARIQSGDAQLWTIHEGGKPIAAVVTGFLFSPKRCLIWLVGGSRIGEWMHDFMAKIEAWAISHDCVALHAETPRRGWHRIAKELGFVPQESVDGFLTWQKAVR